VNTGVPSLPDFERPPVQEVAIGIEFAPLASFSIFWMAEFWRQIKDQYPSVEEHPALPPSPPPGTSIQVPRLEFITTAPPVRFWFVSERQDILIQLQRDRLILNWRRAEGEYPRYSTLISRFSEVWESFNGFAEQSVGEQPLPVAAEVTYVNAIDTKAAQMPAEEIVLLHGSAWLPSKPVKGQAVFVYSSADDPHQETQVNFEYDRRSAETLRLQVTTRVALLPNLPHAEGFRASLDKAHSASVGAFRAVTTDEMHKIWGMKT
jgi:uncharacterized protein (TIGR04255 family)